MLAFRVCLQTSQSSCPCCVGFLPASFEDGAIHQYRACSAHYQSTDKIIKHVTLFVNVTFCLSNKWTNILGRIQRTDTGLYELTKTTYRGVKRSANLQILIRFQRSVYPTKSFMFIKPGFI